MNSIGQGVVSLLGFALLALWICWAVWAGRIAVLIFRNVFNRRR